jgi:hypothetical protein
MLIFSAIGMAGFFVLIVAWLYGDFGAIAVPEEESAGSGMVSELVKNSWLAAWAPDQGQSGEPGWFSTRVVAFAITVFGVTGAILCSLGASRLVSANLGAFTGYVAGVLFLRVVRFFWRREIRLELEREAQERAESEAQRPADEDPS